MMLKMDPLYYENIKGKKAKENERLLGSKDFLLKMMIIIKSLR